MPSAGREAEGGRIPLEKRGRDDAGNEGMRTEAILGRVASLGGSCADVRCEALLLRAEREAARGGEAARGLALEALQLDADNPRATALLLELSPEPDRLAIQLAPQAIRRCLETCAKGKDEPECLFVLARLELALHCTVAAARAYARVYAHCMRAKDGGGSLLRAVLAQRERAEAIGSPPVIRGILSDLQERLGEDSFSFVVPEAETLLALHTPREGVLEEEDIETLARLAHEEYAASSPGIAPWEALEESLRQSNRDQILYFPHLLRYAGFSLVQGAASCTPSRAELEAMARLEHGRWCADRIQSGWRHGPQRDREKKITPYLCTWEEMSEELQELDASAVRGTMRRFRGMGYGIIRR